MPNYPTGEQIADQLRDKISKRNILITGVSPGGLGFEVARILAAYGAGLIVCTGRTESKVKQVFSTILAESPKANLRFLSLDLASLESCKAASEEVLSYKEPIHVLIGNSGIMNTDESKTKDGFESQFGTNHLGHFYFLNSLVPKLVVTKKTEPAFKPRIILVSSLGHAIMDVNYEAPGYGPDRIYSKWAAYGQSKTANVLHALALSKRLEPFGCLSFSLHPGAVDTMIDQNMTLQAHLLDSLPDTILHLPTLLQPFSNSLAEKQAVGLIDENGVKGDGYINNPFKSLSQGVATYLVASFSPEIEKDTGFYLVDCKIDKAALMDYAKSEENAERLWKVSEEMVGMKFEW